MAEVGRLITGELALSLAANNKKMNKRYSKLLLSIFIGLCCNSKVDNLSKFEGEYYAIKNPNFSDWKELRNYDYLKLLRNGLCSLSVFPLEVKGKDTTASSSNGGFFNYAGNYKVLKDTIILKLKIYAVDYAIVKDSNLTKALIVKAERIFDLKDRRASELMSGFHLN